MALTKPFAKNGDKKTIPENTTGDGSLSYETGFGGFYALPPEEGGLYIDRAQFNQLMYDTTSAVIDNSDNITTIQGDVATAQSNITTLQQKTSNLENSVSNINNTISQVISSDVTPIGVYKTVENKTIGTNGDFKTIHDAFLYVQTHQKHSLAQGIKLTLLENNNQDIYFRGAWYPYLVIDCNGFVLANKLTIDLSCFVINNLKLNNRLVAANSILWLDTGDININYPIDDYPGGCITGLAGSIITVGGSNLNFSTTANRSAFHSRGSSMIYIGSYATITQTTGANCFSVSAGGIIQLNEGLNLTGVTVPKAHQAANTITSNGLIIGNYQL